MAEEKSIFHTTGVAGDGEKQVLAGGHLALDQTDLPRNDPTTQGVGWPTGDYPAPYRSRRLGGLGGHGAGACHRVRLPQLTPRAP